VCVCGGGFLRLMYDLKMSIYFWGGSFSFWVEGGDLV
jgi:hypothetical protein